MNIAYIVVDPGIGVFGAKGASVHVQEVIRAMRAAGHRVTVFCSRLDDMVPADLVDLRHVRIPVPRDVATADRERLIAAAGATLAEIAADADFDLVYERYSLFSTAGADLADRLGIPLVVEVNAPLVAEQRDHRSLVDEASAWQATQVSFDRADRIACVSEGVADWVRQLCPCAPVEVVPNGVNTDRIRPGDEADERPVTVGFVGTLKPWHGTDLLIRAAVEVDDIRLDIVGAGPELEPLRALAVDLGLADRVRFRGAVAPEEVPEILAGMDIAVAPYPPGDHYFSPLKVYEYLAAGLPVVASAIGDLPALLNHGRHGILTPPGDVAALAAALRRLVDDADLRSNMGASARATAIAEHSWHQRCDRLLAPVPARTR